MALGLILAAAQLAGGGLKAIQANQERQRQKGIIGRAYGIARERQARRQQDVRQGTAESLGARGLTQGGGITAAAPAGPRTAIAQGTPATFGRTPHTLGEQIGVDNEREFSLERDDLNSREEMMRAGINREADAGIAGGITDGITGAISAYSGAQDPGGGSGSPITSAFGRGTMVDTPAKGVSSPYNGWGGIDPIDPLGRGAWKSAATTGGFNVFNEGVS